MDGRNKMLHQWRALQSCAVLARNKWDDNDVISFHIYASW